MKYIRSFNESLKYVRKLNAEDIRLIDDLFYNISDKYNLVTSDEAGSIRLCQYKMTFHDGLFTLSGDHQRIKDVDKESVREIRNSRGKSCILFRVDFILDYWKSNPRNEYDGDSVRSDMKSFIKRLEDEGYTIYCDISPSSGVEDYPDSILYFITIFEKI